MATPLPAALHLKPEEIDTPEKRSKYTACIVGCGIRGIYYAITFAEAGYKVVCVDADQSSIKKLSKGNVPLADHDVETKLKMLIKKEQITTTNEIKEAITKSDIIIITANPTEENKNASYIEITGCCKQIGAALQKENLIVYSEVAGLGFVEGTIKEILEDTSGLKVGEDFGLIYSPLQKITAKETGNEQDSVIIAALDKNSLNSAVTIFSSLGKKDIKTTMNIEIAELAILFQVAKRDVNLALVNELAIFCEIVGADYLEIMKLTKENSEIPSAKPSIIQEEDHFIMRLLEDSAENIDAKIRLLPLARQINEDMVKHAVNLTQHALRRGEKTLRRAKIAVLGTASSDTANLKIIESLEAKGAKISHYDPQENKNALTDADHTIKKTINEAAEGADCIVILTDEEQIKRLNLKKMKTIMKTPAAIVDLTGTIEPSKARQEGFTYRGLGRGAWKK